MERQIERALRPGKFIHDRASFAFASGQEQVANGIRELLATEPPRPAALDRGSPRQSEGSSEVVQ